MTVMNFATQAAISALTRSVQTSRTPAGVDQGNTTQKGPDGKPVVEGNNFVYLQSEEDRSLANRLLSYFV